MACSYNNNSTLKGNIEINLKWNKGFSDQKLNDAKSGLYQCYSNLGASILNSSVVKIDSTKNIISANIKHLGFNENAVEKLQILHQKIEQSEEYKLNNFIDLGRYITLLIGSSEHYFNITGVPKTLDEILSQYELKPYKGFVNNSLVSKEHRIIEYSEQKEFSQLFFCTEIDTIIGEILEHETIEIMKNGQLRFGLFDHDGKRKNAGTPKHTRAGKPAKCMWCHESFINPLFTVQKDVPGYLTFVQLRDTLNKFKDELINKQSTIQGGVNFNLRQEHTKMELLYISFMEPSAERLSLEWNLPLSEVQNRLSNLQTHTHEEFPFLENLYDRHDVEKYAPYKSLQVSTSVREKSEIEINHIN